LSAKATNVSVGVMKKSALLMGALLASSTVTFASVDAQAADWIIKEDSAEKRPWELGVLVDLPYCCGGSFTLSPGVLLGIPLVDKGFVPINDSFYLEVGAWTHLNFGDPFTGGVSPFGGVRWNFHLMKIWDAYGALRGGININGDGNGDLDLTPHIYGVVGTTWKFSERIGLRGETGAGVGGSSIAVGLDFDF
jgi:hypothetical protein